MRTSAWEDGGVGHKKYEVKRKKGRKRGETEPSQECEAAGIHLRHRGVRQRGGQMERKQGRTGKQPF